MRPTETWELLDVRLNTCTVLGNLQNLSHGIGVATCSLYKSGPASIHNEIYCHDRKRSETCYQSLPGLSDLSYEERLKYI